MIRIVAFDIGKVLLDFDYGILTRRMAPRTRLNEAALNQLLNQSPLLAEYESGRLDNEAFFAAVQEETDFAGELPEFASLFEDIFTPIEKTIALHARIEAAGIATWTFSNTNAMAIDHISRTYDFWPRFTGHLLSHEAGALKPDPEIYQALEEATGQEGAEIAYLDDRPENIAAARQRHWHAIQFDTPEQAQSDLIPLLSL